MSDVTEAPAVGESTSSAPGPSAPEEAPASVKGAETTAGPKKYKWPVNGVEREFDEDSVLDRAKRFDGLQAKVDRAAKIEKAWGQLTDLKKSDLNGYFQQIGATREEAEKWLWENHIRYEQMDPQERERAEFEREKSAWQAERNAEKQQAEQTRSQQYMAEQQQAFEGQMIEALQASDLPKDEETVATMALYAEAMLMKADDNDPDPQIDIAKAIALTKARQQKLADSGYRGLKGDALLGRLGEETVKEVVRAHLAKARAESRQAPAESTQRMPRPNPNPQRPGRRSFEAAFDELVGRGR